MLIANSPVVGLAAVNQPTAARTSQDGAPERARRRRAIGWGSLPVLLLAVALLVGGIPGTGIALRVPYAAQGPGPTFNTLAEVEGTPVIDIEGAEVDPTTGSLDMTTVSVRTNMTMGQALSRWLVSGDTLVPIHQIIPKDMSDEEMRKHNAESFVASEAAATVAAMRYLGQPTRVVVHDVMDGSAAVDVLEAGDTITEVDDQAVSEPKQVQELVRRKKPGDEVRIEFAHGGQQRDATVTLGTNPDDESLPLLGVTMTSEPAGDISVNYNLNDIGGPSAGMIFTLAVVDKLSPGELNGGRHVAGTGTIAEDGTVGPIGGISHKVAGAREAGAELFLAPEDNCREAARAKTGDMVVASVATLDDAISAMHAFAAGEPVTTCEP